MMTTQDLRQPNSELYKAQAYKEGAFYCDLCSERWPLSHRRQQTGGDVVGALCCAESEDSVDLDVRRATARRIAAMLSAEEISRPLRGPDGLYYPGAVPYSDGSSGQTYITTFSPTPRVLIRGGAAAALTMTGDGFLSTDTITYGAAGITDASAPALTGTTLWTLSVQASGGMAVGLYKLTYTGADTTLIFQAVFDVR